MTITFITVGGTIDKIYFDAKSDFQVGEPQVAEVLKGANVSFQYEVVPLLRKDSLEMTDDDRALVREAIATRPSRRFVVTHGTDTMVETGRALQGLGGKIIVLTGAMQPARFRATDAVFNIACAVTAAQTLPGGVYIAMNGRIFDPAHTRKNVAKNRFEAVNGGQGTGNRGTGNGEQGTVRGEG